MRNEAFVLLSALCLLAGGCMPPPPSQAPSEPVSATATAPSTPTPSPTPIATATGSPTPVPEGQFDGELQGWRFAPDAGLDREIDVDCDAQEFGADHPTDLDFDTAYLPAGALVLSVTKWACGELAFSVVMELAFDEYPGSEVILTRMLSGIRELDLRAPPEFVRACEVAGKPAVCVHFLDDATGRRGHPGQVIVIEDDNLDPYAVVFRGLGTELPFIELRRIVTSIILVERVNT